MGRFLLAVVLSATIVFIWGFTAWVALNLYRDLFRPIPNEMLVSAALKLNLPGSGAYYLPGAPDEIPGMSDDEKEAANKDWFDRHKAGPIAMLLYREEGADPMNPLVLARGFGLHCLAAVFLGTMLLITRPRSWLARYGAIVFITLFAVTISHGVVGNFFFLPLDYILTLAFDGVVGWLIAGVVLAALVGKPKSPHAAAEA